MTPQSKTRGREAARRRAAAAAAREAQRRRTQRLRATVGGLLVGLVVVAVVLATIPGGGDDGGSAATTTTTRATSSTVAQPGEGEPQPILDEPTDPDAQFAFGTGECAPDRKPETPVRAFTTSFKDCLKDGVAYKAVVGTSEGSFTIDLLANRAPGTTNNFVQLAKHAYFDGLTFHRVVPEFVIQGGDPNGDGTGGPGYSIPDELPPSVDAYTLGAVAMANSGPNTNGSQFFVCLDCSKLPTPGYSLFGWVSDGFDVVQAIAALGSGDGPPSTTVSIVAVEIVEVPLEG